MYHAFLSMMISIAAPIINATTDMQEPLVIHLDDTVSSLYQGINARINAPHEISIICNDKIILNLPGDHRIVTDIGINETFKEIHIMEKPDFARLLEMVVDVDDIENIRWLNQAHECLFDSSADHCQNVCEFGKGLDCDGNGNLIRISLYNLNLSGTIHLEPMPQTVRALDISYNDLHEINLCGLRGKSLDRLNVEHNKRWCIHTESFRSGLGRTSDSIEIREFRMSSNQMFPWITDSKGNRDRIRNWFRGQEDLKVNDLIIDRIRVFNRQQTELKMKMLQCIEGITNKQVIPWFQHFVDDEVVQNRQFRPFGIRLLPNRGGFAFDLKGLGLEGHIDLGLLPSNVVKLDLSYNNLGRISFARERIRTYHLMELNIQNNHHLRINLMQLSQPCWRELFHLRVSWYQLEMKRHDIQRWKRASEWTGVLELVIDNNMVRRSSWLNEVPRRPTQFVN